MKTWSKRVSGPILALLAACVLQGCATYTYEGRGYVSSDAEYYGDDGDYYGDEYYADDSLGSGYPLVDLRVVNAAYYPWWSLDYYYLGPHYYRPVYLGYSSGWYQSLGYLYSYPPYYMPYGVFGPAQYPGGPWSPYYNAFFSPFYDPWYRYPGFYGPGLGFAWTNSYWSRQYDAYAEQNDPLNREPQYGTTRSSRDQLRDGLYGDPRDRAPANSRVSNQAAWVSSPTRNVSRAPASSNNGTMQVRSRGDRKIRESTIGTVPSGSVAVKSRSPGVVTTPQPTTSISIRPSTTTRPPTRGVRPIPAPQPRPTVPSQSRPGTITMPSTRPATPSPRPIPGPARSTAPSDKPSPSSHRRN